MSGKSSSGRGIRAEFGALKQFARADRNGWKWAVVSRARTLIGVGVLEERITAIETAPPSELIDLPESLSDEIARMTLWASMCPLPRTPKISVIMATIGHRAARLRQAIDSVLAQSYANIEIVLVGPAEMELADAHRTDARIVHIHNDRKGESVARNIGLAAATGEIIAYLDDDNIMGPNWLRAAAMVFSTDYEIDVAYGVRLHAPTPESIDQFVPFLHYERTWDRSKLEQFATIDTNVLVHRAHLSEAHWDESIPGIADWDIGIRLTTDDRVRPIPVVACLYTVDAPERVSATFNHEPLKPLISQRVRDSRTLRVVSCHDGPYPQRDVNVVSTMVAFQQNRFNVGIVATNGDARASNGFSQYDSIASALEAFRPDLLLFHSAASAMSKRVELEVANTAFAVCIHTDEPLSSVDFGAATPRFLGFWLAAPLRAKLESIETETLQRENGVLPCLIHNTCDVPQPPKYRSGVTVVSADHFRRDWPETVAILGTLRNVERRIVLAHANENDHHPDLLRKEFHTFDPRIMVQFDASPREVMHLLSVSSILLYVPRADVAFGEPRSVIEAWLCGATVLLPDRLDARAFAGERAIYYHSVDHAREIIAGFSEATEGLAAERIANVGYARQRFAHSIELKSFAGSVRSALIHWEHLARES